ncbi:hypothetical protein L218DRAFT_407090 [Marasmius fiardii PR-910]|nr:hypothetical protein L218DRAFT_407090 [Marasmius fiardii PR-910]
MNPLLSNLRTAMIIVSIMHCYCSWGFKLDRKYDSFLVETIPQKSDIHTGNSQHCLSLVTYEIVTRGFLGQQYAGSMPKNTPLPKYTSHHPPGFIPYFPREPQPKPQLTSTSPAVDLETSATPHLSFIPHIRAENLFDLTPAETSPSSTSENPQCTYQILQARTGSNHHGPPNPPVLHLDCTTDSHSRRFAFGPDEIDLISVWEPTSHSQTDAAKDKRHVRSRRLGPTRGHKVHKSGEGAMVNTWDEALSSIAKVDLQPRFRDLNNDHLDYEPGHLYCLDGVPNLDFPSEASRDQPQTGVLEEEKLDSYKLVVPILQGFTFIGRASDPHPLERADFKHVPWKQLTRLQLRNVLMTMDDCLEMIWRCPQLVSLCLSGMVYSAPTSEDSILPATRVGRVQTGIRDMTIADRCDVDCKLLFGKFVAEDLHTIRLSLSKRKLEDLNGQVILKRLSDLKRLKQLILPADDYVLAVDIEEVVRTASSGGPNVSVLLSHEGKAIRVQDHITITS